jgi:uncharacterized membrane protein YebE (DUF533 family)
MSPLVAEAIRLADEYASCCIDNEILSGKRMPMDRSRAALLAHLQKMGEDAERLDWIDQQWTNPMHLEMYARSTMPEAYEPHCVIFTATEEHRAKTVRAAIDAAIAKGKEP